MGWKKAVYGDFFDFGLADFARWQVFLLKVLLAAFFLLSLCSLERFALVPFAPLFLLFLLFLLLLFPSQRFHEIFQMQKHNPLGLEYENVTEKKELNPFFNLYKTLKKHSLEVLAKNRHFSQLQDSSSAASLSLSDIDFVASHLCSQVAYEVKNLERHLYILSTTVSLAPFLGLLGTVWGILTTFSAMQTATGANTHQMVLSGLSLALATTVLGLIDAIPALMGYNYLKHSIKDFATDMEGFSNEILTAVELQYRKVEH